MAAEFSGLSVAEVEGELLAWAGRVAAGEARLVALIGEFDRREGWAGVGMVSCAQWLSWRTGMGLKAAHERVRVARKLAVLPVTEAAFSRGELSWTQRIVEDEADPELAAHRMRGRVSYDADGMLVLSVRLPAEQGALLLAAVEQARGDLDQQQQSSAAADSSAEDSVGRRWPAGSGPGSWCRPIR